jgi:hypothetical protein
LFAGAVREKLRTWSWRASLEAAPNCLMPEEYMMLLVVEGRFLIRRDCADSNNKTRRRWVYVLGGQEASMAAASVKFDDA